MSQQWLTLAISHAPLLRFRASWRLWAKDLKTSAAEERKRLHKSRRLIRLLLLNMKQSASASKTQLQNSIMERSVQMKHGGGGVNKSVAVK